MSGGGHVAAIRIERGFERSGQATGTWITWRTASRWHHSIGFDGYGHDTSCGLKLTERPWNIVMSAHNLPYDARVCRNCLKASMRVIHNHSDTEVGHG